MMALYGLARKLPLNIVKENLINADSREIPLIYY